MERSKILDSLKDHTFCFVWNEHNQLPNDSESGKYFDYKMYAKKLYEISSYSPYASSNHMYEDFLSKLFIQEQLNCFHAFLFIYEEEKNTILGFLNARVLYEEVEIDFVCVREDMQGRGIAQILFHELEQKCINNRAQRIYTIFLEVSTENKRAIAFYNKLGFQEIGVREKYYKNGEDAYTMRKSL